MPQGDYMDKHRKEHGRRLDHEERTRKREAREAHTISAKATNLRGFRAKMFQQERHKHKIQMRKQIKALEEKNVQSAGDKDPSQPLPSYLLDRNNPQQAKSLSSAIKNRRSEKEDMFKVVATGKRKSKGWKRMVTMPTFVVKYERFIRPMGLRYKKCHVTHPGLNVTVQLAIISVKKNPSQQLYTQLGVLTKGTIIEVNVSELGLTTAGGKVVWGRCTSISSSFS
ncbi:ribosomal protein S8e/ribosomal biogenesis NSA2 [Xylaria digitata]|nr:ribosomal protein S8e/ribosomal biogenesis NSA2 [Xylaria digitata]